MKMDATNYRHRLHIAWQNVQANRRLRPADFINGFRMVQPLRTLPGGSVPFDMTQLAVEMFTRLNIHYEPLTTPMRQRIKYPLACSAQPGQPRVGLFLDAPDHVSGVSLTIGEWQEQARRRGCHLVVHTCAPVAMPIADVVTFPPMGTVRLDAYSGLTVHIPRMDELLRYIDGMDVDVIHISTPGPVGLLGLLAARRKNIPVCGTYHTDFPRYAGELTGDAELEQVGWRFMQWFYGQMHRVAAPTESIRRELMEHGFDPARIEVVGRGVDTEQFHPGRRDAALRQQWGQRQSIKLLYAGRLSREKNLETLAQAFRQLCRTRPDVSLVLAGDGPYRAELQRTLADLPVFFTGLLSGEKLWRAFASCDLFVFPSKTDTFGRVVLEAQAAGLPVVVSASGGPKDAMRDGETGVVVPDINASRLASAVDILTDDPAGMARYAAAARAYACTQSREASFEAFWRLHQNIFPAARNHEHEVML